MCAYIHYAARTLDLEFRKGKLLQTQMKRQSVVRGSESHGTVWNQARVRQSRERNYENTEEHPHFRGSQKKKGTAKWD